MEPNYMSRRVSLDTFHRNFYQSEYGKLTMAKYHDQSNTYIVEMIRLKSVKTTKLRHASPRIYSTWPNLLELDDFLHNCWLHQLNSTSRLERNEKVLHALPFADLLHVFLFFVSLGRIIMTECTIFIEINIRLHQSHYSCSLNVMNKI